LRKVVERWDGWLVSFLNGEEGQELRDIASGLLTVPLKVRGAEGHSRWLLGCLFKSERS
jgi:hypothetical protein